jgi:PAT family beta-lactamase induction signal transducer AmpG
MGLGVVAVLASPREARHALRSIHLEGITPAPVLEALEWIVRLVILLAGALILGSGLSANAAVLAGVLGAVGAAGVRDGVLAAWQSDARAWVHLAAVLCGFAIIVIAALPLPGARTRPGVYLSSALADPLRDFFSRYGATGALILALICFYRIPDFIINIMNPFYLDLGYTLVEIAEVRKVFGVFMTMFGVFVGGLAVARYGVMRTMVTGAVVGPVSNLLFIWLAVQSHSLWSLFIALGLDNVASGFAGTCLIAYMSSLTSLGFTATQYALFSSLYAIPGRLLASQSGRIVEGAARAADAGGTLSAIKDFVAAQAPGNFVRAIERSGVSPAALGTGYIVFFAYSAAIGVVAIVLAIAVRRRQQAREVNVDAAPQ